MKERYEIVDDKELRIKDNETGEILTGKEILSEILNTLEKIKRALVNPKKRNNVSGVKVAEGRTFRFDKDKNKFVLIDKWSEFA